MKLTLLLFCFAAALAMFADDRPLPPHFPRVKGIYQMTDNWSVTLPTEFAKRFENGSLVFWRKGLTCWTVVYNLKDNETPQQRLAWLTRDIPKNAIQCWTSTDSGPLRYAYLLREHEDAGERWALYTFTVGEDSHVMMAIYFDNKEDLPEARAIGLSISPRRAPKQASK